MAQARARLHRLSRREFLRRAGLATVATAVTAGTYRISASGSPLMAARTIPSLWVDAVIAGIAAGPDRMVAVAGRREAWGTTPELWTVQYGQPAWSASAGASDFPLGTAIAGIAALGGTFLAAGAIRRVSRVQRLVDDDTGRAVVVPIAESRPAIFSSADGRRWEPVVDGLGPELGAFVGIAAAPDRSSVLAVGSRFLEPGVEEGHGLLAVRSQDGTHWRPARLVDVEPPGHGSATLVARFGREMLVGIRDVGGTRIHSASGQRWRSVPVPVRGVSYIAAAATPAVSILSGIDDWARSRVWEGTPDGWRERRSLGGVPDGAMIVDLEEVDDRLVAAGSSRGKGFVAEVGG